MSDTTNAKAMTNNFANWINYIALPYDGTWINASWMENAALFARKKL